MPQTLRIARGCHLPADHAEDSLSVLTALLATAPAHTAVSGLSAAQLHGLWLPTNDVEPRFTTYTPGRPARGMTRPRRAELSARRQQFGSGDVVSLDGIPVTSPVRTWWDLASVLALPDLVAAGDSLLRSTVTLEEVADMVRRMRGRRGNRAAGIAATLLDARSRSRPESHLRVAVAQAGLPTFDVNEAIADEWGEWLAEPDLSCEPARIALEYQGAEHAEPKRMRRDITRLADLRRAGWLVLLYGPAEVFGRPWQIAPELRTLIAVRAPQLLRAVRGSSSVAAQPPRVGTSRASGR
jgi:very-short-patch-repair endonuclease